MDNQQLPLSQSTQHKPFIVEDSYVKESTDTILEIVSDYCAHTSALPFLNELFHKWLINDAPTVVRDDYQGKVNAIFRLITFLVELEAADWNLEFFINEAKAQKGGVSHG